MLIVAQYFWRCRSGSGGLRAAARVITRRPAWLASVGPRARRGRPRPGAFLLRRPRRERQLGAERCVEYSDSADMGMVTLTCWEVTPL
jgi:hypothetical protein